MHQGLIRTRVVLKCYDTKRYRTRKDCLIRTRVVLKFIENPNVPIAVTFNKNKSCIEMSVTEC